MPERFTYTKETVRYCTGRDFHDACERFAKGETWVRDTAQEAYNALPFWEEREEGPWDVFEFQVVEKVEKVEPPYTPR